MMNLTLKYSKNNDFLPIFFFLFCFVFESQKHCFPRHCVFSILCLISVILFVFRIAEKLPL